MVFAFNFSGRPQLKRILILFSFLGFTILGMGAREAKAANELITIPMILADYNGWAYTEIFEDNAQVYGWTSAGVDALGWGLFFAANDYDAGLFLVNIDGIGKTVYPVVTLLGASDPGVRERAWIAVGTHTVTITTLELLGRPALSVQTSLGPSHDGLGLSYALKF